MSEYSPFLFIGFSFADPNLSYILSRIRILIDKDRRAHYCFFRNIKRSDFIEEDEYNYENIRQKLRISDLKRYGIKPILVDDYNAITDILKTINNRIKRRNIFFSGAAADYGVWTQLDVSNMLYGLAYNLAAKDNKIISGFGLGVGNDIINGVLSYVYEHLEKHLGDSLITYPFPQNIPDADERKKKWTFHREMLLKEAGIAVFLLGNKRDPSTGSITSSDGMMEEFRIAERNGAVIIPVGCSQGITETIWKLVMANPHQYYGDNLELIEFVKKCPQGRSYHQVKWKPFFMTQ